jgi:hypothetical protein
LLKNKKNWMAALKTKKKKNWMAALKTKKKKNWKQKREKFIAVARDTN